MQMIRWMCDISMKYRRTNEELRRMVGLQPIITVIRSGRLRWYGHVMRKGDEDWVKKCMKFRVEAKRPVGRPRRTWLDSVEVDMTELEIDTEDTRGTLLENMISGSNFGIIHWDSLTRLPGNANPSSPDVSLASASLITSTNWQTKTNLGSDNLPYSSIA